MKSSTKKGSSHFNPAWFYKVQFNILFVLLAIVFLLSTYIRIAQVANGNFPFTMDQARDMLDIRNIVVGRHLTLIGPTTSINGVFLGPSYYYFNTLPFILGSGDPTALVYWNILWFLLGGGALFYFFYTRNKYLGLISTAIYLIAPVFFPMTRYFWNSNVMPYVTVFYFISLFLFFEKPTTKKTLWIGLFSGLAMQFEAAFAVLFYPFALIIGLYKRIGIKKLALQFLAFFITLIPQILFELRHQFLMTKTFIAQLNGSDNVLGDQLTFVQTVLSHGKTFLEFMDGLFILPQYAGVYLILISSVFLIILSFIRKGDSFTKTVFWISFYFVIFGYVFYLFYFHQLKGWYLFGIRIPFILIISVFLYEVGNFYKNHLKLLTWVLVSIFLVRSFILSYQDQMQFIPKDKNYKSSDKSNFRNELTAIDWTYEHTGGKGFKAFNYIPSVYDFPYQYLYWWYGAKKYGYHPQQVSYLENVPEYIPNNAQFFTKSKLQEDDIISLIYEQDEIPDRMYAWLGSFTKYCSKTDIKYTWGATVEIRVPCDKK